jgi:hypothetical protein
MEKGMKPMPVIFKIVWIILIINSSFSLMGIAGIYAIGFDFMGMALYGLYAINVFFLVKIALPIVLIVGMHQRYGWIWIFGLGLFLLYALNNAVTLQFIVEPLNKMMEQMSEQMTELPEGIDEEKFARIMRLAFEMVIVFSMLINLTVALFFILKRKFFTTVSPAEPPSETELPS